MFRRKSRTTTRTTTTMIVSVVDTRTPYRREW